MTSSSSTRRADVASCRRGQFRSLADRHTGIGFDQALVLHPPRRAGTAVYYQIFNSDGDEVEQCGNGVRCIARSARQPRTPAAGRADAGQPRRPGARASRAAHLVSVEMGVPNFEPAALPFEARREAERYAPRRRRRRRLRSAPSASAIRTRCSGCRRGRRAGRAPGPGDRRVTGAFRERVNVGFMEDRRPRPTSACGFTSAAPAKRWPAAPAPARRWSSAGSAACWTREVRVRVRGGELRVDWAGPGEPVWLTGPAEVSFEGYIEV